MTSSFKGFATPEQAADLYLKLVHDCRRMRLEPRYAYAAFDFFVTAEHMVDRVIPGIDKKAKRAALRKSNPVLRTVSHAANGSKHFEAESVQHKSV